MCGWGWRRGERREGGQSWKYAFAGIRPFDFSEVFADWSEEGNLLEGLVSVAIAAALARVEANLAETSADCPHYMIDIN